MKLFSKLFFVAIACLLFSRSHAQTSNQYFKVKGDSSRYYPVVVTDSGWRVNTASEITIGRSDAHTDKPSFYGSIIATFRYHTTNWGHGSNFITADIRQFQNPLYIPFVASFRDASFGNGTRSIIIWLRGNTSYYFTSKYKEQLTVYDGETNPLPYVEMYNSDQILHNYKTGIDQWLNSNGSYYTGDVYQMGSLNYYTGKVGLGTNVPVSKLDIVSNTNWTSSSWGRSMKLYKGGSIEMDAGLRKFGMGASSDTLLYIFSSETDTIVKPANYNFIMHYNGNIGIGTYPREGYKMAVEGMLGARRIRVTQQSGWADFVFHPDYKLPSLGDVEAFINKNGHLPDIPTAEEVKENGVDVGEMNRLLLQKVEELTLHLIRQEKLIAGQQEEIKDLKKKIENQH
ncbi:hypothetical protein DVR12_07880 [Chitinophaga silvatica]|uniref:Peptidase S74 domain-containing protein n=1 Tax=Chitinophaga silvatica TaxID=2282649 RepID=A0A3E1YF12_9BACT|nr:hypothetical protein [Chitinophaga silvatica]RFS25094.1 hypothetical protein DVR12_07880 [Chitinophaga silvatica]